MSIITKAQITLYTLSQFISVADAVTTEVTEINRQEIRVLLSNDHKCVFVPPTGVIPFDRFFLILTKLWSLQELFAF